MVFVFGGTNDYGHGDAEIGTTEDNSPYTFCGGLNNLFAKLSAIYGKEKFALSCLRAGSTKTTYAAAVAVNLLCRLKVTWI